jgi:uncharacterized protein (TIGR03000 family)
MAHIRVIVPPDAQVWFDDQLTNQMGPERVFYSPELSPGRDFVYEVKARWKENGRDVTQTRQAQVHAGDFVTIDFTKPDQEAKPTEELLPTPPTPRPKP